MRIIKTIVKSLPFFFLTVCSTIKSQHSKQENCCDYETSQYPRIKISRAFLQVIDSLIPVRDGYLGNGYNLKKEDCHFIGFFAFDLVDTLNNEGNYKTCVRFKDRHIYHFAPKRIKESYSSIAILKDGEVKIFRAINCPDVGDSFESLLKYITNELPEIASDPKIMRRVNNYRKYGSYIRVDELSQFIVGNCLQ